MAATAVAACVEYYELASLVPSAVTTIVVGLPVVALPCLSSDPVWAGSVAVVPVAVPLAVAWPRQIVAVASAVACVAVAVDVAGLVVGVALQAGLSAVVAGAAAAGLSAVVAMVVLLPVAVWLVATAL